MLRAIADVAYGCESPDATDAGEVIYERHRDFEIWTGALGNADWCSDAIQPTRTPDGSRLGLPPAQRVN